MAGDTIPCAILRRLERNGLHLTFFNDNREGEDYKMFFHERNLAGRGLDFDDFPEDNPDFVWYTMELRCINPVLDTKKTPLPSLEDLAEAVTILLHVGL